MCVLSLERRNHRRGRGDLVVQGREQRARGVAILGGDVDAVDGLQRRQSPRRVRSIQRQRSKRRVARRADRELRDEPPVGVPGAAEAERGELVQEGQRRERALFQSEFVDARHPGSRTPRAARSRPRRGFRPSRTPSAFSSRRPTRSRGARCATLERRRASSSGSHERLPSSRRRSSFSTAAAAATTTTTSSAARARRRRRVRGISWTRSGPRPRLVTPPNRTRGGGGVELRELRAFPRADGDVIQTPQRRRVDNLEDAPSDRWRGGVERRQMELKGVEGGD
eukprot:30172-Pelagococcus_subviridis.AAC.3